VLEGKDVNIKNIPTPICWHRRRGAYISRLSRFSINDPDSGLSTTAC